MPNSRVVKQEKDIDLTAKAERYGLCPKCEKEGVFFNVMSQTFVICEQCKTWWHLGPGVTPTWRDENFKIWAANAKLISECEEVEPHFPKPPEPEREQVEVRVVHSMEKFVTFKCKCIENCKGRLKNVTV